MAITFSNGDVIAVRLNYRVEDNLERLMNILYYQLSNVVGDPPNLTTGLTNIAETVYDAFAPIWAPCASEDVSMVNVTVNSIFPTPRSVAVTAASDAGTPGGVVSQALPLQDCPTILKKTDIGARGGMGRMFVVGLPESFQDRGVVTGPALAALNDLAQMVKADINIIGTDWTCDMKPVLKRGPDDNPVSLTAIRDALVSDPVLKTQRRRRPGKGD